MATIWRQLRKHPDIVPVFVITIIGATFAGTALFRACLHNTDVSFRRKTNPHPWLNVKPNQETKFFRSKDGYDNVKVRPKFEE